MASVICTPTPSLLVDVDVTIFAGVICPQLFSTTSLACYFNPQYLTLYRRETQSNAERKAIYKKPSVFLPLMFLK